MGYWSNGVELNVLNGQTIINITGLEKESDEVRIFTKEGNEYLFYHSQDCCENVSLNDFDGDALDLIGGLIVSAEEVEGNDESPGEYSDSYTWTFYKIETNKGGLWMRWLGESNGYYSESVDFAWVNKPKED